MGVVRDQPNPQRHPDLALRAYFAQFFIGFRAPARPPVGNYNLPPLQRIDPAEQVNSPIAVVGGMTPQVHDMASRTHGGGIPG